MPYARRLQPIFPKEREHSGFTSEYQYSKRGSGLLQSMLWERMVQHTIRSDFKDGFVLPYAAVLRLAQEDADFDPEVVVAPAPMDRLGEFSYATEHVTHGGAIGAPLACTQALERAKEHLVEAPGVVACAG